MKQMFFVAHFWTAYFSINSCQGIIVREGYCLHFLLVDFSSDIWLATVTNMDQNHIGDLFR